MDRNLSKMLPCMQHLFPPIGMTSSAKAEVGSHEIMRRMDERTVIGLEATSWENCSGDVLGDTSTNGVFITTS